MSSNGISLDHLSKWREAFENNDTRRLAQMGATRGNFWETFRNPTIAHQNNHHFNVQVKEVKPVSNQLSSGRCWIFALLNCIRVPFCEHYGVSELEFSQSYLFYWDKLERSYYELHLFLKLALQGESVTDRRMSYYLTAPVNDGGQWDMLVNLVLKYGIMPKDCWLESSTSEASQRMNYVLRYKLRQFSRDIFKLVQEGKSESEVKQAIDEEMFPQIYNVVNVCLGTPPKTFQWTYKKDKEVISVGPIHAKDFYETYVKKVFDIEEKICLIHDPRSGSVYTDTYTVENLNNMVGAKGVLYLNLSMDQIKQFALKSLKAGEPVWFGSDINKEHDRVLGLASTNLREYKLVFGLDLNTMSKEDKLNQLESCMNHAMLIVAAHEDPSSNDQSEEAADPKKIVRWRVENSWGGTYGNAGYLSATDEWFDEFVYQVVVDKKYVTEDVLEHLKKTPHVLPPWDPFGTLA